MCKSVYKNFPPKCFSLFTFPNLTLKMRLFHGTQKVNFEFFKGFASSCVTIEKTRLEVKVITIYQLIKPSEINITVFPILSPFSGALLAHQAFLNLKWTHSIPVNHCFNEFWS